MPAEQPVEAEGPLSGEASSGLRPTGLPAPPSRRRKSTRKASLRSIDVGMHCRRNQAAVVVCGRESSARRKRIVRFTCRRRDKRPRQNGDPTNVGLLDFRPPSITLYRSPVYACQLVLYVYGCDSRDMCDNLSLANGAEAFNQSHCSA
jgi:hypothetical protein